MAAATSVFLGLGLLGIVMLALSLVVGDLLHVDLDGWVSLPVVAGFVGTLGFGGAIVAELVPGSGGGDVAAGLLAGIAAAVPVAWLTGRLVRAARTMHTDATLSRAHLVGATGVVVSALPAGGYGEVRLSIAGAQMKFNATARDPLPVGTRVLVVDAPTDTSVVVEENTLPNLELEDR